MITQIRVNLLQCGASWVNWAPYGSILWSGCQIQILLVNLSISFLDIPGIVYYRVWSYMCDIPASYIRGI